MKSEKLRKQNGWKLQSAHVKVVRRFGSRHEKTPQPKKHMCVLRYAPCVFQAAGFQFRLKSHHYHCSPSQLCSVTTSVAAKCQSSPIWGPYIMSLAGRASPSGSKQPTPTSGIVTTDAIVRTTNESVNGDLTQCEDYHITGSSLSESNP